MDDFWGWVYAQLGNILGVVGVLTGAWFYWLARKPKRFGFQVISATQIISDRSRVLPLQVVYDGREVTSPNIIVLRVGNAGKAEIHARDFDGPVRIEFSDSTLLSAAVSRKYDEGIAADIEQHEKTVTYTPPMLNAGEWVEFQLVTDGPLEEPTVHARVAGQNGPSPNMDKVRKKMWEPVAYAGMALGVLALPLGIVFAANKSMSWIIPTVGFIGLILLVGALTQVDRTTGWAKSQKMRKNKKPW